MRITHLSYLPVGICPHDHDWEQSYVPAREHQPTPTAEDVYRALRAQCIPIRQAAQPAALIAKPARRIVH